MKNNKTLGTDKILPEFLKHLGPLVRTWLVDFFSDVTAKMQTPQTVEICESGCPTKTRKEAR